MGNRPDGAGPQVRQPRPGFFDSLSGTIFNSNPDRDFEEASNQAFFSEFVRDSCMQQRQSVSTQVDPDPELADLPLIQSKYRIISRLGAGAFGFVLRVHDTETGEFLAMKCLPMSLGHDGKDPELESRRRIVRSAETELSLLPRLLHPNIVQYIASFLLGASPLDPKLASPHLCLLMEYVMGSDLEHLLQFSESKSFHLTHSQSLSWFITLLRTCSYFHSLGISHRDLKPDNVLVSYETLDEPSTMGRRTMALGGLNARPKGAGRKELKLVLTDFGSGLDVSQLKDISEGSKQEVAGHMFYSPPEILHRKSKSGDEGGADGSATDPAVAVDDDDDDDVDIDVKKIDTFALGIMLFQLFVGMSTESYQREVKKLCHSVKEADRVRIQFCDMFGFNSVYDPGVSWLKLLYFVHQSQLFRRCLLFPILGDEGGDALRWVLERMICPVEQRWTSSQLVRAPMIRTWAKVLGMLDAEEENDTSGIGMGGGDSGSSGSVGGEKEEEGPLSVEDRTYLFGTRHLWDLRALVSVLGDIAMDEPGLMERTLNLLLEMLQSQELVNRFLDLKGDDLESLIMAKAYFYSKYPRVMLPFYKLLARVAFFKPDYLRPISIALRTYDLVSSLKKTLLVEEDIGLYFFCFSLIRESDTLRVLFKDSVLSFFLKYNRSFNIILFYILQDIAPLMEEKEEVMKILTVYTRDNIVFLKRLKVRNELALLQKIFPRVLRRLKVLASSCHQDAQNEEDIVNNLVMILSLLCDRKMKSHELSYRRPPILPPRKGAAPANKDDGAVRLRCGEPPDIPNVQLDPRDASFECINGDPAYWSELVSSTSLRSTPVSFKPKAGAPPTAGSSVASCYYEVDILDGGNNDTLHVGLLLDDTLRILLDCGLGVIRIEKEGKEDTIQYRRLLCGTGCIVGCGLTSRGELFYTYDNKLVRPFVPLTQSVMSAVRIHALVRVSGNDFLKGRMNAPLSTHRRPFHFRFKNLPPSEENVTHRIVDVFQRCDLSVLDILLNARSDSSDVFKLCTEIQTVVRTNQQFLEDEHVLALYDKDVAIEKIVRDFPRLGNRPAPTPAPELLEEVIVLEPEAEGEAAPARGQGEAVEEIQFFEPGFVKPVIPTHSAVVQPKVSRQSVVRPRMSVAYDFVGLVL